MQRDPGVLGQPVVDLGVFVGVVVVHHDVQLAPRVGLGDLLQEVQELGLAVPVVALVDHLAGGVSPGMHHAGARMSRFQAAQHVSMRVAVEVDAGREVDVVQSSFSTPRWGDACQKLRIVNVPFYIDVPRTSPLARKTRITVADLEGMRLRVLRHGNDAMDSLRIDLLADGGVDVIDVDSFDFALFNEAEEKGDAVLTCGAWSGVHPAFVGVPFLCGREVPVFLHYPLEPTLQVQKFVNAMAQLLK